MDNNNRGKDAQFLTLHQASSNVSTSSTPSGEVDLRVAARKAAKLFGCYPRNDANDPDTFLTAATALLASYPEVVADRVCDPIRGLPTKNKFLPALAEIREACEREMIWHDAVERRERDRKHTAKVLAPALPPPTAESRSSVRQAADELLAELKTSDPRKMDFRPPRSPSEAEAARRYFEARLPELKAENEARPVMLNRAETPPPPAPDADFAT